MSIFKKILANILCATILLSYGYSKAEKPTPRYFLDLLPIQEQFDALYFYTSYLKIKLKAFEKFDTSLFNRAIIENMTQWRKSLFEYIENLISSQKALFFCCIYYHINPQSNIMACAPPSAITDFKIYFTQNVTNSDSTSGIISAFLTYGRIKNAKIMI